MMTNFNRYKINIHIEPIHEKGKISSQEKEFDILYGIEFIGEILKFNGYYCIFTNFNNEEKCIDLNFVSDTNFNREFKQIILNIKYHICNMIIP